MVSFAEMPGHRLAFLLALASMSPLVACEKPSQSTTAPEGQDQVDELTRSLLIALHHDDPAKIAELTTAELAGELDERARAELARTLDWLGGVDRLERLASSEVVGGVERRYSVAFTNGAAAKLRVTAGGGKVIGFEFDDPSWPTYVERAANSGSLKVAEFALTAPDGQPLTGPLDPKAIHYSIALEGLGSNLREHHVTIDKVVMDAKGTQVYRQREPDDIRFPEAEIGSSGGRLSGSVAVPGPGKYELELKIVDLVGGESIVHRYEFVIE